MASNSSATAREHIPHATKSTRSNSDDDASNERIALLTVIICQGGDEAAVALLVLLAMLQDADDPRAVANSAKHIAFTRCGELNLNGIVDVQIATLQHELFAEQI